MRGRRPLLLALLVVGATALGAAGCGGGGKSSNGPTKASFIASADAICKQTHAQASGLITEIKNDAASLIAGGGSAATRAAGLVARLGAIAGHNLARLRALATPSGDRAAIARFLTPLGTIVHSINRAVSALRSGQTLVAASLLGEAEPIAQRVASAARAYGLTRCTQVLSPLG